MATAQEGKYIADVVKFEESRLDYSRDVGIVAAGQNLAIGVVVAKKTTTGKLHALNPSASDGTQTAVGVLIQDVDATLIDKTGVFVARHAVVADNALVWPSGISAAQKAAAIAQLEAKGILVRSAA